MKQFQFLIGRLATKRAKAVSDFLKVLFQFLIGRLATSQARLDEIAAKSFNSL